MLLQLRKEDLERMRIPLESQPPLLRAKETLVNAAATAAAAGPSEHAISRGPSERGSISGSRRHLPRSEEPLYDPTTYPSPQGNPYHPHVSNEAGAIVAGLRRTPSNEVMVTLWTPEQVCEWLRRNSMPQHWQSVFRGAQISGSRLVQLVPEDLASLGLVEDSEQSTFFSFLDGLLRSLRRNAQQPQDDLVTGAQTRQAEGGVGGTWMAAFARSRRPSLVPGEKNTLPAGERFGVSLERGTKGFGFTLVGGEGHSMLPSVSIVNDTGPAAGKLQMGDIFLAVNGRDLAEGSHQEVVDMIKRCGEQLHLMVLRPSVVTSPKILSFSREISDASMHSADSPTSPRAAGIYRNRERGCISVY